MKRSMALLGRKRGRIFAGMLAGALLGGGLAYLLQGELSLSILWAALVFGMLTLVMVSAAMLLKDISDDTVNSPEKLRTAVRAPVLSCIPHCTSEGSRDDASVRHLADSYNTLRNNAGYVCKNSGVFAVTSATAGDGKTTVAINLAKSLVSGGKKVAIVDADMRNPSVHRRLRLRNGGNGLSEALEYGEEAVFVRLRQCPGLYVLRAGLRPEDPSYLLRSESMKGLLDELQRRFDYVVIDAPPVLPVPDCAALAQNVGCVVFVARYGSTTTISAQRARTALDIANARFSGAVLNDVPAPICRSYGRQEARGRKR